jgi:hypothetical protein
MTMQLKKVLFYINLPEEDNLVYLSAGGIILKYLKTSVLRI